MDMLLMDMRMGMPTLWALQGVKGWERGSIDRPLARISEKVEEIEVIACDI